MLFLLPLCLLKCGEVQAFCFQTAGARYQIDPQLLRAIAKGESSLNPQAMHVNRDKAGKPKSIDYGLMQINSRHIPRLKAQGIILDKDDLLMKPCLNVQIGAWILAKHFQTYGVNWNCLGSYNAGFGTSRHEIREHYADRIWRIYQVQRNSELEK